GCPQSSLMRWAITRARMSVGPPAGNGTTMRTARSGNDRASDTVCAAALPPASSRAPNAIHRRAPRMRSPGRDLLYGAGGDHRSGIFQRPSPRPGGRSRTSEMRERFAEISTLDGQMEAFVTYPAEHAPCPAVIVYMDVFGPREELYDVARRIATVGYYVMVP